MRVSLIALGLLTVSLSFRQNETPSQPDASADAAKRPHLDAAVNRQTGDADPDYGIVEQKTNTGRISLDKEQP